MRQDGLPLLCGRSALRWDCRTNFGIKAVREHRVDRDPGPWRGLVPVMQPCGDGRAASGRIPFPLSQPFALRPKGGARRPATSPGSPIRYWPEPTPLIYSSPIQDVVRVRAGRSGSRRRVAEAIETRLRRARGCLARAGPAAPRSVAGRRKLWLCGQWDSKRSRPDDRPRVAPGRAAGPVRRHGAGPQSGNFGRPGFFVEALAPD